MSSSNYQSTNPGGSKDQSIVMTANEVAALLGVNRKTVYDAAAKKQIPSRRIGRRVLFYRAAIVAWLEAQDRDALES